LIFDFASHRVSSSKNVKEDLEYRAVVSEGVENKDRDVGVILNPPLKVVF